MRRNIKSFFGLVITSVIEYNNIKRNVSGRLNVMGKKKDIVQVRNPKSGHYVKIDRDEGKIIGHKKSEGPYKDVPIARKSAGDIKE